jgi:Na+-driven multidrug efflux pump
MQMGMGLLNAVLNRTLLRYGGDTAVAAMGIIYSILILVMMPLQGLNQGAQPIIGYNYGAKKYARVIGTFRLAVTSAVLFVGASFAVIQLFPSVLIGIFGRGDSRLMDLGTRALRISTLMFPVVGFQVISANFFQAVGKPKQGTLLSLSRQLLLLIPLVIVLPRFFGLYGVFFAMPLADLGSFVLSSIMIAREMRRLGILMHRVR